MPPRSSTMARHASPGDMFSPSPPPQQPTKRDIRRNKIMERLQAMIDGFSQNQHQHYRAQLQAIQVDMTMVLRADPYDGPLEDGGQEIEEQVRNMSGPVEALDDEARRDYIALAGRKYRAFVRLCNDQMEERDAMLTQLHVSPPRLRVESTRADTVSFRTATMDVQPR